MDWLSFTLSVTLDSARLMREAMILFYTGTSNFSLRDVREGTGLDGLTQVYLSICTGTIQFRNANIYLIPHRMNVISQAISYIKHIHISIIISTIIYKLTINKIHHISLYSM